MSNCLHRMTVLLVSFLSVSLVFASQRCLTTCKRHFSNHVDFTKEGNYLMDREWNDLCKLVISMKSVLSKPTVSFFSPSVGRYFEVNDNTTSQLWVLQGKNNSVMGYKRGSLWMLAVSASGLGSAQAQSIILWFMFLLPHPACSPVLSPFPWRSEGTLPVTVIIFLTRETILTKFRLLPYQGDFVR